MAATPSLCWPLAPSEHLPVDKPVTPGDSLHPDHRPVYIALTHSKSWLSSDLIYRPVYIALTHSKSQLSSALIYTSVYILLVGWNQFFFESNICKHGTVHKCFHSSQIFHSTVGFPAVVVLWLKPWDDKDNPMFYTTTAWKPPKLYTWTQVNLNDWGWSFSELPVKSWRS